MTNFVTSYFITIKIRLDISLTNPHPSTLCCGLVGVCVLYPFYSVLWVDLCLCSVSLLHCLVGWLVFVFCVPSTLPCGLVGICVLYPFYTVLWGDLCLCSVSFYTVLWVGQCLCSVSLLLCVVGWSVFTFCVPSTLYCGLIGVCFLCPFYAVLWVGLCVLCPFYTVLWVDWCFCFVSLLRCVVGWFVFCVLSTLCCGLVGVSVLCPFYTVLWVGWCFCSVSLLHCDVG